MDPSKSKPPSADLTADKGFPAGSDATSPSLEADTLPPAAVTPLGSVFQPTQVLAGRFTVVRFIARGGMGEVYEAEDEELNERVAVKTARFESAQSAHEIERFRREIQLARKVTHPNVCRTFDVFRHGATPAGAPRSQILIVSMELLSGETLDKHIRGERRMTTAEALPLVEQMCAGLGAAHRVGVIHRDFKSSNVMLVRPKEETGETRAVITDFGLAHAEERAEHTLTKPGDIVGTPSYMAPEQIEGGAITPATDIYALGIVIYEMVTGMLPFSADTPLATAMKRLSERAPSPRVLVADVDPKWEAVIARCLERVPEARFATTEDVARALRGEAVTPSTVIPRTDTSVIATEKTFLQRAAVPLTIAVLAIALVAGGLWWWLRHRAEQEAEVARQASAEPAAGARKSVAILGFQNLSGRKDAEPLGNILSDSLWSQLDTAQLRVIPPARVDEMKQNLRIGDTAKSLSKDQLAAIRQFLGADILVTGAYTVSGAPEHPNVQWNIHLLSGANGDSAGSVAQSGTEQDLNALVVHSGRLVRQHLGVTLSAEEEARMDASLSSNPDAMRYYSQAREKLRQFDVLAATKLLEQAVTADPKFAQAHSALAQAWDALGFESKAAEEGKKALASASGLSVEARSRAGAQYYAVTRDWTKAIQEYSQLWAEYRDEPEYGLLLANTQVRAGKPKDALTTIGEVRSQKLPPGFQAQADIAEASAHDALGNYKEELNAANSAAQTAQSMNANLLLARARILQCVAHISLGEADAGKPLCEEAKKINLAAGDQLGVARSSNDIATAYYAAGNFAAAEPLYQEALSLSQSIGDAYDEAGALNNLANIASARGEHASAVKTYEKAIAVANERNEKGDVVLAQQNMAIDLYWEGDIARGQQMFASALTAARALDDKALVARVLNNQCYVTLNAGAVADARKSCEESLRIRREINEPADIGRTLANLGAVQMTAGDLAGAQSSLNDGLAASLSVDAKNDAAYTRIGLARLAIEQKKLIDAAKFANDAATELAAEKDAGGEAEARLTLARAMLASGNVQGARVLSDKATELAAQSGDRATKLDAAVVAALVDARDGKAADALVALAAAQKDAKAAGMVSTEYDARLALGETQTASGKKAAGQGTLRALASEAKAHGFGLIAQKAAAGAS